MNRSTFIKALGVVATALVAGPALFGEGARKYFYLRELMREEEYVKKCLRFCELTIPADSLERATYRLRRQLELLQQVKRRVALG